MQPLKRDKVALLSDEEYNQVFKASESDEENENGSTDQRTINR